MDEEWMEAMLPVHVQRQLDQLLESWAEQMPTPPAQIDLDNDHISIIANDHGYEWWRRLFDQAYLKPIPAFPPGWPFHKHAG
ncbi:hypothetical protein [Paenibacillus mendelii]|uniref:Uncharacterized protein n=1 Tax=Paenibacillus mendelii TaxID=206163 RepID=A0ABV6J6E1_9BACL|nr:hypothetical protein [Paenibacillus mendelii]MCQ6561176.1 hypothetical protein [Paenibacillus mendelii]